MNALVAYTPLLDPLDLHNAWWLTLAPLALGISIAYKAIRMRKLSGYWRAVLVMTIQVVLGMIALAGGAFILIEVIVYRLA